MKYSTLFMLIPVLLLAVPAPKDSIQFYQPDSSISFWGYAFGDEFYHWRETTSGYTFVISAEDGYYYYADLDQNGKLIPHEEELVVGDSEPWEYEIEMHLKPGGEFKEECEDSCQQFNSDLANINPLTGTIKVGIIIISFQNQDPLTLTNANNLWYADSMYFSKNYWIGSENDPNNPHPNNLEIVGSMYDYWQEVSYSKVNLEGNIITKGLTPKGNIKVSKNKSYYESLGRYSNELIYEAIDSVLSLNADTSNYDVFSFIYAGPTKQSGALWPHAIVGNKFRALITGENYNNFWFDNIGIATHEFGHAAFGFVDLYPENSGVNIANFGLMGPTGLYNGPAHRGAGPAHPNVTFKIHAGFLNPVDITQNCTNISLADIETDSIAYKINLPSGDKFYLANRQPKGFDKYLLNNAYNGGLIIWQNHGSLGSLWMEQADGLFQHENGAFYGDNGDVFPGTTSNKKFCSYSTPNSNEYSTFDYTAQLKASGISIENIQLNQDSIITCAIYTNKWAGKINDNIFWEDTIRVIGDIEINKMPITPFKWSKTFSNQSFHINPNTKIYINVTDSMKLGTNDSKIEFIVNGYLQALGKPDSLIEFMSAAASPSPGDWAGIKFLEETYLDTFSVISNAVVKHAYHGLQFARDSVAVLADSVRVEQCSGYGMSLTNDANPTVLNSEVKNCNTGGVKINSARGYFKNNEFHNNLHGMYLYYTNNATSGPKIIDNEIHDNTNNGIYMYQSSPDMRDNEIYTQEYGLNCRYSSSPQLGKVDYYGNNIIYDHDSYGIYAYQSSNPFLGIDEGIYGGNNSITSNRYHVYANYYCTIYAENNYWGSDPPDTDKFRQYNSSFIDYTPWLATGPMKSNPVIKESITEQHENVFKDGFNPNWPLSAQLNFARKLVHNNEIEQAQKICKSIIRSYPDSAQSFYALDILRESAHTGRSSLSTAVSSFTNFIDSLSSVNTRGELFAYAAMLKFGFNRDENIQLLKDIAARYVNTRTEEIALFQQFMYYLEDKTDEKTARKLAYQIDTKFPDSESSLEAHRLLGDIDWSQTSYTVPKQTADIELLPDRYALFGNFPNPFNPVTLIKYALPKASSVTLKIYNILGEQVKTFNFESKEAGYHHILWNGLNENGNRAAAGMYLYEFKAISQSADHENFQKNGKMILLK